MDYVVVYSTLRRVELVQSLGRYKAKVKVKSLSHVWLFVTPWTAAYQASRSMGFSRQEYWSGVPLPSPKRYAELGKWSELVTSVMGKPMSSQSGVLTYLKMHQSRPTWPFPEGLLQILKRRQEGGLNSVFLSPNPPEREVTPSLGRREWVISGLRISLFCGHEVGERSLITTKLFAYNISCNLPVHIRLNIVILVL